MRRTYVIGATAVVLLLAAIGIANTTRVQNLYERISFAIHPTAEKAFLYGGRHFTSLDSAYNIDTAEYYYQQAAALDTNTPYLFHELARIAFLRGKFPEALALINIQISKFGDTAINSYYVRALIEGYMEQYAAAEADYSHFLQARPNNWAAINDYAWVLLKAGKSSEAQKELERALSMFPGNAWLLNSYAIALYESGDTTAAYPRAAEAVVAARMVTREDWLTAYPGNDPGIADEGIAALKIATEENIHRIEAALHSGAVQ